MPDLAPGTTVAADDTPPAVGESEIDSFTFTNTTYGVAATGGYADCAAVFTAPTSGRVVILYGGSVQNSNAGASTLISPVVREGGVVGSGAVVVAASDNEAIAITGTTNPHMGRHRFVSGLTPGSVYNVRLEHRVTASTGTSLRRNVTALPTS